MFWHLISPRERQPGTTKEMAVCHIKSCGHSWEHPATCSWDNLRSSWQNAMEDYCIFDVITKWKGDQLDHQRKEVNSALGSHWGGLGDETDKFGTQGPGFCLFRLWRDSFYLWAGFLFSIRSANQIKWQGITGFITVLYTVIRDGDGERETL